MFDPRPVHMGFVDEVAVGQVFLLSSLVFPCHYHFIDVPYLYFIYLTSTVYNFNN